MKCGSFVKYVERRRKGSGAPYMRPLTPVSWWAVADLDPFAMAGRPSSAALMADGYTVCDGTVSAKVEIEYEPYFGGCSESINVSYKCDKCGQTFFPELPSRYGLDDFLTGAIEALTDAEVAARREEAMAAETRHWKVPA